MIRPTSLDFVLAQTLPWPDVGLDEPLVNEWTRQVERRSDDLRSFAGSLERAGNDAVERDAGRQQTHGGLTCLVSTRGGQQRVSPALPLAQYVPFRLTVSHHDQRAGVEGYLGVRRHGSGDTVQCVPVAGYSLGYADHVARLVLFASAREAAGRSEEVISGETVADVLDIAKQRFGPKFESVLGSCTIWLNGEGCNLDARVGASDEVAVLPPVSGGADLSEMSLDDLRAKRAALQSEEDAVSFVRRLAQGRLDIARDEVRRRSAGAPIDVDITDGITRVFSAERGTGSNRPPRDTEVVVDHPLLVELEQLCDTVGFGGLRELDDDELTKCTNRLSEFESRVSSRRKDLFAEIDVFSGELVRRYRASASDINSLLDESR